MDAPAQPCALSAGPRVKSPLAQAPASAEGWTEPRTNPPGWGFLRQVGRRHRGSSCRSTPRTVPPERAPAGPTRDFHRRCRVPDCDERLALLFRQGLERQPAWPRGDCRAPELGLGGGDGCCGDEGASVSAPVFRDDDRVASGTPLRSCGRDRRTLPNDPHGEKPAGARPRRAEQRAGGREGSPRILPASR